ncbi:MAG: hypothetical protein JXK93_04835 [Sphaerochaetaceae bacterium]|nr:hypothetical protein [Sphaerochaetaceae bacterium]
MPMVRELLFMALITCDTCGTSVSEKASDCRFDSFGNTPGWRSLQQYSTVRLLHARWHHIHLLFAHLDSGSRLQTMVAPRLFNEAHSIRALMV